jgi:hypothetical protein
MRIASLGPVAHDDSSGPWTQARQTSGATTVTADEWASCDDPKEMVCAMRGKVSDRKNRLFNVACCRRIWHLFRKPAVHEAILVGERYADGLADREQLRAALRVIHQERARTPAGLAAAHAIQAAGFVAAEFREDFPFAAASEAAVALWYYVPEDQRDAARHRELLAECELLREILGNPFRRVSLKRDWLTPGVLALAGALYEERDFAAMPVLADALEEAGCTCAEVLDHLRGPNGHVRGCWVLDLVLARE